MAPETIEPVKPAETAELVMAAETAELVTRAECVCVARYVLPFWVSVHRVVKVV